jgi:hypothetical protein
MDLHRSEVLGCNSSSELAKIDPMYVDQYQFYACLIPSLLEVTIACPLAPD